MQSNDAFCRRCGTGNSTAWTLLAIAPSVAAGLVAALVATYCASLVDVQGFAGDLLGSLCRIVLGSTIPYALQIMAVVGAATAVYALNERSARLVAMSGGMFATLYAVSCAVMECGDTRDVTGLGLLVALGALGAVLAAVLGTWPAKALRMETPLRYLGQGSRRFLSAPIAAWLAVVIALLAYAAVVVAVVAVLTLIAIAVACGVVLAIMRGEGAKKSLFIPKGGRIREDGRIVREGGLFEADEATGQRVLEDGRIVEEGGLFSADQPTGLKIGADGRLVREGFMSEQATGIRFVQNSDGSSSIVKEGFLTDTNTGLQLTRDGRAEEYGIFCNDRTGVELREDGEIFQVHGELARGDRLRANTNAGGVDVVEKGLFLDTETGIRIDQKGGHKRGMLFGENDADIRVDAKERVKERR